jgi:DnaJ-class molecular chaperone
MNKKIFDPEKYGMIICPSCDSHGFIQNPKRQCCPTCGGFGFIIKEAEQDTNHSGDSGERRVWP